MAYLQIGGGILKIFFLFLLGNICCGYLLEVPQRGASNEYHKICLCGEIKKYQFFSVEKNILSGAMSMVHYRQRQSHPHGFIG